MKKNMTTANPATEVAHEHNLKSESLFESLPQIVEVKLEKDSSLVFFGSCHCSAGNTASTL